MNRNPPPVIAQGLFSYQIGGSERVGADLAIEFKRRGFRVICFAFYDTDGPIRAELNAAGIECIDLDYQTRQRFTRRLTYQFEFLQVSAALPCRCLVGPSRHRADTLRYPGAYRPSSPRGDGRARTSSTARPE